MSDQKSGPAAVYRLYDTSDRLLYVGISRRPEARMKEHRTSKLWFPEVARTEITWHDDRVDAALEERRTIVRQRPPHNVIGQAGYGLPPNERR